MSENHKFNRQKEDYVISDLLPYEKGNIFTNRYFYEYILKNRKLLNKVQKNMKVGDEDFDSKWHSSPFKFKVRKKDSSFREISMMNPLATVESLVFLHCFEQDLLNIIHNNKSFSVRKPQKVNSLLYKKNKKQTVYYSNQNEKNQLLLSLESSGIYFDHKPFKRITDFYNSNLFSYYQDKFKNLLCIDIQDCFSSIYTHSFKWLITKKTYDSKSLQNSRSIYRVIDAFLQNVNGSKTNGILIGPEMMRLLAEFLFVHIDQKIIQQLSSENIFEDKDYKIFRFVDDYFIFTNNIETENIVFKEISSVLNDFHLKINNNKIRKYENKISLNKWIYPTKNFTASLENFIQPLKNIDLDNIFTKINENLSLEDNFEKKTLEQLIGRLINPKLKNSRYNDLRNEILTLIENTKESTLTASYILSVILKKIEENDKENHRLNIKVNELILTIFFIYSKDVTFTSTQKMIRILTLLIDKYDLDVKESIEKSYERFEEPIFNGFKSDWIDLLLFNAVYKIEIPERKIIQITDEIFVEKNPLLIANICMFFKHKNNSRMINKKLNELMKDINSKINWKSIFQDEKMWFIIIFYSYSGLNKDVKQDINHKLSIVQKKLEDLIREESKVSVYMAQKLVIDFLLSESNHYIEWDFIKKNYYKKYYFFTKDRTIFNPTIINQSTISR